ncbi:MAG: response regulator [Desulfobacteraceae bacterium]|nr:MAG: response regulator [Desulfobacteraceae bacterium]
MMELRGGNETILLVDDERIILEVARDMLEELGYQVIVADNGEEALKIFASGKNRIDLVVLDMKMPKMDGSATYDRLKAVDPGVRVILSSGYGLDDETEAILRKGCNGFIQKPFGIVQLATKIREVLEGQSIV